MFRPIDPGHRRSRTSMALTHQGPRVARSHRRQLAGRGSSPSSEVRAGHARRSLDRAATPMWTDGPLLKYLHVRHLRRLSEPCAAAGPYPTCSVVAKPCCRVAWAESVVVCMIFPPRPGRSMSNALHPRRSALLTTRDCCRVVFRSPASTTPALPADCGGHNGVLGVEQQRPCSLLRAAASVVLPSASSCARPTDTRLP